MSALWIALGVVGYLVGAVVTSAIVCWEYGPPADEADGGTYGLAVLVWPVTLAVILLLAAARLVCRAGDWIVRRLLGRQ